MVELAGGGSRLVKAACPPYWRWQLTGDASPCLCLEYGGVQQYMAPGAAQPASKHVEIIIISRGLALPFQWDCNHSHAEHLLCKRV